jgi:hypothetical protein
MPQVNFIAALLLAGAPVAQPALAPLATLVGHCWSGPAPGGAGIDTHCFDAVFGGQHIRDRHSVKVAGKQVYAGESIYSVRGVQVVFTYWNSLGGLGTGHADLSGGEWQFGGTIHASPGAPEQPMQAVWKLVPEGYEVSEGSGDTARMFRRVK